MQDSNLRRQKPLDLESNPVDRLGNLALLIQQIFFLNQKKSGAQHQCHEISKSERQTVQYWKQY